MNAVRDTAPTIVVVAAVVEQNDSFLITRRLSGVHLAGYWEFPGGKCHDGETDVDCLRREIREELDADVDVAEHLLTTTHRYPDRVVELRFFRAALIGQPRAVLGQQMRWAPRLELATLEFPPADRELIEVLVRRT